MEFVTILTSLPVPGDFDNAVLIVIFVLLTVLVRSEIAGCIISQVVAAYTVIPVGKGYLWNRPRCCHHAG